MLPFKDLVFEEFDLGVAISDFLIIFPSDSSTVELEVFMIFLFNPYKTGFSLMLPFVFPRKLPLNGL